MGITSETSMVNGWTLNGEVCLGVQSAGEKTDAYTSLALVHVPSGTSPV